MSDYILDDKSIADLLPELDRLPPNPDSNPTDADMMGNTLSGDIQSVEENVENLMFDFHIQVNKKLF